MFEGVRELLRSCVSPRFHRDSLRQPPGHTASFLVRLLLLTAAMETSVILSPLVWALLPLGPHPLSEYVAAVVPEDLTLTLNSDPNAPFVTVNRELPYAIPPPGWMLPYIPSYFSDENTVRLLLFARSSDFAQARDLLDLCFYGNSLFVVVDNGVVACQYLALYTRQAMVNFRGGHEAGTHSGLSAVEYRILTQILLQFYPIAHVTEAPLILDKADIVEGIAELEDTPILAFLLRDRGFLGFTVIFGFYIAVASSLVAFIFLVSIALACLMVPVVLGWDAPWMRDGGLLRIAIYALPTPVFFDLLFTWQPPSLLGASTLSLLVYSVWIHVVIRSIPPGFDPAAPMRPPVPPPAASAPPPVPPRPAPLRRSAAGPSVLAAPVQTGSEAPPPPPTSTPAAPCPQPLVFLVPSAVPSPGPWPFLPGLSHPCPYALPFLPLPGFGIGLPAAGPMAAPVPLAPSPLTPNLRHRPHAAPPSEGPDT